MKMKRIGDFYVVVDVVSSILRTWSEVRVPADFRLERGVWNGHGDQSKSAQEYDDRSINFPCCSEGLK
jgi:hypothetical protein